VLRVPQVHVPADQADQPVIAANVQADLVDLVPVDQVAQARDQVDSVDLVQREIVQADSVDLVQVAQVAQADLLVQEQAHQVQQAHQVVVQAAVQIHQVVAAMLQELLVSLVVVRQRVVSLSALSVKSTTT
jgi:hypothetical protein